MGPSLHLRPSRTVAAVGLSFVGLSVAAAAFSVGAPAASPVPPAVIPAVIANALEDAQLTAADLALTNGDKDDATAAATRAGRSIGLLRLIIGRTERAEITVTTDAGIQTLLYVRGAITDLSGSALTVTLADSSRALFAITGTTRVREKGRDVKASDLSTGDRAMVLGLKN